MNGTEKQNTWANGILNKAKEEAQNPNWREKTMRVKVEGEMKEFEVNNLQKLIEIALDNLRKNGEITLEQMRDARRALVQTDVMPLWAELAQAQTEAKWWIENRDENINRQFSNIIAKQIAKI